MREWCWSTDGRLYLGGQLLNMSESQRYSVLLVEDEVSLALIYQEYLRDEPYDIITVETGSDALAAIADNASLDIVILDLNLPDMNGLEVLEHIQQSKLPLSVVVVTAHGSINTAVDAMRLGAADFLLKPFNPERFVYTLRNAHDRYKLTRIVKNFEAAFDRREYEGFIGTSLAMQAVYKIVDAAAPSSASVFITGESGTGKEVCAEALHARSARRGEPFIALSCAAIPRDLMESEIFGHIKGAFTGASSDRDGAATLADGGTLFLDEICEMDLGLQAKLLRFIHSGTFQKVGSSKTKEVDVRFVCATNRDPWAEVAAGNFREDLLFRLHVIPIHLPPLRERDNDITQIADAFLEEYTVNEGKKFTGFSADSRTLLNAHKWPGNVRELQNVLRNAVILNDGNEVTADMLQLIRPGDTSNSVAPESTRQDVSSDTANPNVVPTQVERKGENPSVVSPLWQMEKLHIERALDACDGNVTRAAAMLEIGASTLYRRLKAFEQVSVE
jgi:two-component system, repressor protein LuxO